jgi:hypothetical protein
MDIPVVSTPTPNPTPNPELRKPCLTGKFCKGNGYLTEGTNGMYCEACRTHRTRKELKF